MKSCICNNMDGSRQYYATWNKSEKDKYHMTYLYVESEKQKKQTKQNEDRLTDTETKGWLPVAGGVCREK